MGATSRISSLHCTLHTAQGINVFETHSITGPTAAEKSRSVRQASETNFQTDKHLNSCPVEQMTTRTRQHSSTTEWSQSVQQAVKKGWHY